MGLLFQVLTIFLWIHERVVLFGKYLFLARKVSG